MGSILVKDCVNLEDLGPEILCEYEETSYTVATANGSMESGWRLSRVPHHCLNNREGWQGAHAILDTEWRVFLYNETENHSCGWRRISTFWPTDIKSNALAEWRHCLITCLDALEAKRQETNSQESKLIDYEDIE
jgi:hypothetical protein